ncbi:MAG: GGDEF domain-containing protein, partial [Solirubrobacteraceae bacterium]
SCADAGLSSRVRPPPIPLNMATFAMAVLAASVALGYFTIAAVVAPRIRMPSAGDRIVAAIRAAAIAFFVGCGLTHVHILLHTLGASPPQPVEAHEVAFHAVQAIGAWLFIAGALLRFELHVVPSSTRVELQASVDEQRAIAADARRVAQHDELTGLARRWRFDEELERQVARARRYEQPGALLVVDVDDFKAVNDAHGHPVGDAVLRRVASRLRSGLRESDLAARIGGDEFAIILPAASLDDAVAAAERIVASQRVAPVDGTPPAAVSAGIAAIDGELPADEVVRRADRALYDAKRAGGDRYAVSEAAAPAVTR